MAKKVIAFPRGYEWEGNTPGDREEACVVMQSKIILIKPTIDDASRHLVDATIRLWKIGEATADAVREATSPAVPLPASTWPVPVNPVLQARFGMPDGSILRKPLIAAVLGALLFSVSLGLLLIHSQSATQPEDRGPGTVVELLPLAAPDFSMNYSRQVVIPPQQVESIERPSTKSQQRSAAMVTRQDRRPRKVKASAQPLVPEEPAADHNVIDDNPY